MLRIVCNEFIGIHQQIKRGGNPESVRRRQGFDLATVLQSLRIVQCDRRAVRITGGNMAWQPLARNISISYRTFDRVLRKSRTARLVRRDAVGQLLPGKSGVE